jgi:hypothetical protein
MNPAFYLSTQPHGVMPGAADEILAIVFLIFAALAGWHLFREK